MKTNNSFHCWYTGIELFKHTSDLPILQLKSKEHILNQCSFLFKHISKEKHGIYRAMNVVHASAVLNSSIPSFTVPMKLKLKEILVNKIPQELKSSKLNTKQLDKIKSEFHKAQNKVYEIFNHDHRIASPALFHNQIDTLAWDFIAIQNLLPQMKFNSMPKSFFISEC